MPEAPLTGSPTPADIRSQLHSLIVADLLGPAGPLPSIPPGERRVGRGGQRDL